MELEKMKKRIQALATEIEELRDFGDEATDEQLDNLEERMNELEKLEKRVKVLERAEKFEKDEHAQAEKIEVVDEPEFRDLGEYLQAITRGARTGMLPEKVVRYQKRAALGSNEAVSSDGGFLVDTDFSKAIMSHMWEEGQVASRCDKLTVSGNSNGLILNGIDETSRADGSRYGGIRGYWADEAASVTATSPKFNRVELRLNKLMATYYATDELLQDAPALAQTVSNAFGNELAFKLDDAIINGDGAGKPQGILNASALVTVAKETSQSADTINYNNILKMYSRFYGKRGVWFANRNTFQQLATMSVDGSGTSPVYLPANGASGRPYDTLMGMPLIFIEQAQTLGDKGDIILADMSQYQLIDKGGVVGANSIHVQFLTGQVVYRWVFRVDGQSKWNSAVTPFNSTSTVSPFVTLAERTT